VLVASALAVLADQDAEAPVAPPFILNDPRPSLWTRERLYRDHMFHGPAFRGVESIQEWGRNGMQATLVSPPVAGLFQGVSDPVLLTDPVIADAAGQLIAYWVAEHLPTGFNVFPRRVEALQLFGPRLSEAEHARCQVHIREVSGSHIRADLD